MSESTTPFYDAVPAPTTDTTSLMNTCIALKANVDSLTRQRGTPQVWAATVMEVATGANGDGNFPTNAGYLRGLVDQAISVVSSTSQGMGTKINRAGDTMTGPLTLSRNPMAPMEAATMAYVDSKGSTDWNAIPNRPVAFPPKPHTHGLLDVIGLQVELDNRAMREHTQGWDTILPPEGSAPVAGHRLTWNGTALVLQAPQESNAGAGLHIAAAPPVNTDIYPFWFDVMAGDLYIHYNDGDSAQWVPASSGRTASLTALTQRITALEAAVAALQP